ncbi:hypothetical protein EKO27_g914 [Xylaria grammica]|uniref:FAD-binding domain-containing protein n=1 Tax=Xylaria grammica TaxID=363999 RepID=A0A439DIG8_9PEZI|nr:hypothetical protein EKO27_g914 [Xylaria grammica]
MHWWSYYLTPPKARTGSDGLHVGIIGAGIGGMAAAVAIRYAGVQVTVPEAAEQLGEIGAGIQVTPNVSVLLQTWGVDKVIGDNLVQFEELNMRRKDGTRVGHTNIATLEKELGPGEKVRATQPNVPIEELRNEYKDFDPRIKRITDMVPNTVRIFLLSSRWPLMVTGPLRTWSSPRKNVVLMGDAAHSMVNHMAQGAATAMEDGAFLAKCLGRVVSGDIRIDEAVTIYERERQPKAYEKQQVSFLNGAIWHLPDGVEQRARHAAMNPELEGKYYHAETALAAYLSGGREPFHPETGITQSQAEKYMSWFAPSSVSRPLASKL